jgi:hypothetical protein
VDLILWAVLAAAVLYVVECVVWPYRRCWPCRGTGRLYSPITRSWRECRCGGDGQAIRWGRRVFDSARRIF